MAKNTTNKLLTILAAGVTTSFATTDAVDFYDIKASGGAVVLAGNVTITGSGTPSIGTTYTILVGGGFTLGGFTFSIFGSTLTAAQCLYKQIVFCYYNGTTWDVYISSDDTGASTDIDGADIVTGTITNAKLAGSIALTKLAVLGARGYTLRGGANGVIEAFDGKTAGTFLGGNGIDVVMQTMSGAGTLNGSGVLTLSANSVVTSNITDANVTLAKLETILKTEVLPLTVSFETGEQTGYELYLPYACTIVGVTGVVVKAIAATDAGTITGSCNGVNMTTGVITCALSDALGTTYSITPTGNNVLAIGQVLKFVTLKTTVGGKVLLSVSVTRA